MKYFFILILVVCNGLLFAQADTTITSLSGFESADGVTQLIYRIYCDNEYNAAKEVRFDYRHFNTSTKSDSVIFPSFAKYYDTEPSIDAIYTTGYSFFNNDPNKYIISYSNTCADAYGDIIRYDRCNPVYQNTWGVFNIFIDNNDTNKIFADLSHEFLTSTDGGYTWNSPAYQTNFTWLCSSPNNVGFMFGSKGIQLVKSLDTGKTITVVSLDNWNEKTKIIFDKNNSTIYALNGQKFYVSTQTGDVNTWEVKKVCEGLTNFCIDSQVSGLIYLSDGNKLYKSTDAGASFELIKDYDNIIVGLYKKPNSETLYVAFKERVIKRSGVNEEVIIQKSIKDGFVYLPYKVGNFWIYHKTGYYLDFSHGIIPTYVPIDKKYRLEVVDYKKVGVYHCYIFSDSSYVRINSITQKVYQKSNYNGYETEILDLSLTPDDLGGSYYYTSVSLRDTVIYNRVNSIKTYTYSSLYVMEQSFLQKIGMIEEKAEWDEGESITKLIGCKVNWNIFGDTTLVSVADENIGLAVDFSLYQNYPNPFNPSTVISYSIPEAGEVSLKVFDVLGKEITTLVNAEMIAGSYTVNFNTNSVNNGKGLSSGVYFYTLKCGNLVQTKKMMLVR